MWRHPVVLESVRKLLAQSSSALWCQDHEILKLRVYGGIRTLRSATTEPDINQCCEPFASRGNVSPLKRVSTMDLWADEVRATTRDSIILTENLRLDGYLAT